MIGELMSMDEVKLKQESSKPKFTPPEFSELLSIQWEIQRMLPKPMFIEIVFTGSTVLNLLGLIEQDVTDIDVILNLHTDGTDQELYDSEKLIQDALVEGGCEIGRAAGPCSGFEMIAKQTINGYPVEFFIEHMRRHYQLGEHGTGLLINISHVSDMFTKKWQYDQAKTKSHVGMITDHLNSKFQEDAKYQEKS